MNNTHPLAPVRITILVISMALLMPSWTRAEDANAAAPEPQDIRMEQDEESTTLEPMVEQTVSSPPLGLFQQAQLAESQVQLAKAREQYRAALQQNPEDPVLRAKYAWFLYSNGFHDKECLRLLERSLQSGATPDPASCFNAIVEVRDELGLPSTPLKKPPGYIRKTPKKERPTMAGKISGAEKSPDQGKRVVTPEESAESFRHWLLIPSYSYSFFNEGRQGWQEEDVQLYYRVNKKLMVGGEVDILQRPPSGTNIYYSALFSYYLWKYLEVHGKISICPAPTFAATQVYSGGLIYQAMPRLGLLMDYQRYNFIQGPLDQINPGIVFNINDDNWIVLRYVRGWAFYDLEYNYYSAALNLSLPGKRRLSLAFAYGTDPDAQIGADGTNVTTLSPAYTYSIFFTQPITRDLNLFAGIQYCYRLTENNNPLYQQLTPTIGCSLRF
ncbi:MAG: hypothetical protein RLZZ408_1252 [Verrucomicrobiota bacterium]|jgi:hypothetical protein